MSQTYELTVQYTAGQVMATWDFNGEGAQPRCTIAKGDKIHFNFEGPGTPTECALISGKLRSSCHGGSPFVEGNRVDLLTHKTLTARDEDGLWGFTISFAATDADGTTSFYFVPDPELQLGTIADGD